MKPIRAAIYVTLIAVFGSAAAADAGNAASPISRREARAMILADLKSSGYAVSSPQFEVDDEEDQSSPKLFRFAVYFDMPDRLATIGFFAVDSQTAEAWDKSMCRPLASRPVATLQAALRRRHNIRPPTLVGQAPCF